MDAPVVVGNQPELPEPVQEEVHAERVVPIIPASVSWLSFGIIG